jgi:predicted  nucleic acid-binding Zn-ribbon protein
VAYVGTHPAIRYAEDLGLDAALKRATEARDKIDNVLSELSAKRDERRAIDEDIAFKEMDIQIDARVRFPDHSLAAWERDTKTAQHNDPELRALKQAHRQVTNDIEGLEYDLRVLDTDVRIASARMNELGGYFAYLAAVKNAETLIKKEVVRDGLTSDT